MHFSLPLLLAGMATALPYAAKVNTITDEIVWNVSEFSIGCSQGGCIFDFDISGSPNAKTPAFNTHCTGAEKQEVICEDKNITTTVSPAGNPIWNVDVTHRWQTWLDPQHKATWFQKGAKNVSLPDTNPVSFTFKPTKEYGVA